MSRVDLYDAIIIGGGAAGLFCAITGGKRGKRVLVLEHNAEVGRKIVISGGGRCNFTNLSVGPENFISQNPHFCKSALAGFTAADFVQLVRKHKIDHYEKKLGQLFCRDSSRQIVNMLLAEARAARVEIRTSCSVRQVRKLEEYEVDTTHGVFHSRALVVACGGLSFPKIGASDLGYRLARQFGHKIVSTRPSLVAMVFDGGARPDLAGVSVDAAVSSGRQRFRENVLFTHRGLSGPAILQISNYWDRRKAVQIDLLPSLEACFLSDQGASRTLGSVLTELLPERLIKTLFEPGLLSKKLAAISRRDLESVSEQVKAWKVSFRETEGWDRAEVTLGGVSTHGLNSKTMGSKQQPGLYFIGEVVDVTGWLGGYNFQWAWASGFAAGNAV